MLWENNLSEYQFFSLITLWKPEVASRRKTFTWVDCFPVLRILIDIQEYRSWRQNFWHFSLFPGPAMPLTKPRKKPSTRTLTWPKAYRPSTRTWTWTTLRQSGSDSVDHATIRDPSRYTRSLYKKTLCYTTIYCFEWDRCDCTISGCHPCFSHKWWLSNCCSENHSCWRMLLFTLILCRSHGWRQVGSLPKLVFFTKYYCLFLSWNWKPVFVSIPCYLQVRLGWYSQRVDGQDDQCGKGSRRCHQRFQRLKMGTNSVSTLYWKSKYIFILSFLMYVLPNIVSL